MRALTERVEKAARGHLIRITAHDLRNPISGILSASESLLEDLPGAEEEHRVLLRAIQSSCESMLRLIDDRMEEFRGLHLQSADVVSLVRRQLALAVPLAERKGLKLALIIQGNVPPIRVDTQKISLVFNRLMRNAIQSARPESRLRIQVELKNDRVILSVRAGTTAYNPAKKGRKQPSAEEAGGKGFAVITRIIEGHGGQFKLNDKLGTVSITVTLPVTPDPTAGG